MIMDIALYTWLGLIMPFIAFRLGRKYEMSRFSEFFGIKSYEQLDILVTTLTGIIKKYINKYGVN